MKLLLDSCIWPGAKVEFAAAGHQVEWVGDWMADPGDEQVLAHAAQNNQILITLDKDFGELAVAFGSAHAGILRLVDFRSVHQAPVCLKILESHGADLADGSIVTVEPGRTRVRPPDEPEQ